MSSVEMGRWLVAAVFSDSELSVCLGLCRVKIPHIISCISRSINPS